MNDKQKSKEKVPFSCRVDADTVAKWKAYTNVEKYGEMGEMTATALQDYMKAHPLRGEKREKYLALYKASTL